MQESEKQNRRLLTNVWRRGGEPFNLSATMASGQAFRWRKDAEGVWWGAVENTVIAAYQEEGKSHVEFCWQTFPVPDQQDLIERFFRLDIPLESLYTTWIRSTPVIEEAINAFQGLRILRQPPVECFFSFQCASCNTVVKIERSVHLLAKRYGCPINLPEECASRGLLFRYPTIGELARADEQILRSDLWGYRAPRVIDLAKRLMMLGEDWLPALRSVPYRDAHAELSALPGIGPKVADCICLFSLDKDEAVPIDTHTRQIGMRIFDHNITSKSLTARAYNTLAENYRNTFGAYAGWAQQYLFFAELKRSGGYSLSQGQGAFPLKT